MCVVDRDCERFVDVYHAIDVPPSVTLRRVVDSSRLHAVPGAYGADDPRVAELGLTPPEMVTLLSRDGARLHGALYRPEGDGHGEGPWPVVVSVYGGPHAQRVRNAWDLTVDMRAQALRRLGFLVFVLDNRGSARRGLAFEGVIRHHMGTVEIQDQVDGVRWLVDQGLADPDRVGIYGWSYGGYMAAMCLAQVPDVFHAAVSGAPVTSWDGYDTCYTERYMGTPESNPEGYERGAVMHHVEGIRGRLLLVHGMLDENVHFRHTARLVNALIRARKRYELLLFPDERHMPRGEADRIYMEERIQQFLVEAVRDRVR
jgi:dipeptidyl-peptidase-4